MPVNPPAFRHEFTALAACWSLVLHDVEPAAAGELARRIERRVAEIVARYAFRSRDSWLNRVVNERRSPVVALDDESARLLAAVHGHARATGGAFDVTLGTYAGALRRVRTTYDAVAVRRRLARFTGLERWRVEGALLHFDNPATRLDLGGVVPALALDEAAALARAAGVRAGRLHHGADVLAFGAPPGGQRCLGVVPDPRDPQRAARAVALDDQALAIASQPAPRHARRAGDPAVDEGAPGWAVVGVVSGSALASAVHARALLADADLALPPAMHAVAVTREGRVQSLGEGAA